MGYGDSLQQREARCEQLPLNGIQEVVGSIPIGSTIMLKGLAGAS